MKETIYLKPGNKKLKSLPNKDFIEFTLGESSIEEFFKIYENLFYDLTKFHHEILVEASTKYIGTPPNPKEQEIVSLNNQKIDIEDKILSIVQEHPIFKNGKIIVAKEDTNIKYYIQSKKLRKINNFDVINKIKVNNGLSPEYPNSKFEIKLDLDAINSFEISSFEINTEEDLNLSIAELERASRREDDGT
jgi:hypothetical protein